jgi:hypothetical protein
MEICTGKECTRCGEFLDLSHFSPRKTKMGYQSWCKKCIHVQRQSRYSSTEWKESHSKHSQDSSKKRAEWVFQYLETHPCVDCGETNILCLEFDHIEKRSFSPADTSKTIRHLEEELKKCQVRCANCHTRVTHKREQSPKWMHVNPLIL